MTVVDKDVDKDYRIYMNNVLDYRGYRFFQSSYDKDEMGTVLSVNYDLAGTIITYLGYLLLALGMVSVFFTRQSRFKFLTKKLSKANLFLLPFLIPLLSFSSEKEISYIYKEHSKKFDRLLVQDQGGRIKPMNTLCSEYLRKISKKNSLENLNSTQVILSMMVNPHEWASKDIIKVKHEHIKQVVGATSSRTSFKSFFEKDGTYKLKTLVEQAYEKEPINRGKLEKDIISVDERVNICFILFNGDLMRIFPLRGDPNNTWYNSKQHQLFSGKDSLFVSNILKLYFSSINSSYESKNWTEPDSLLNYMIKFQNMYASSDIMPSKLKINTEIWYNNLDIFGKLYKFYIVIGLLMLISLFYEIFNNSKTVKRLIKLFKYLIFSGFVFHTIGLAFRWIASGHAPWSNGYESMIYTAWATLLSGIIFSKKSNFTLSATAIVGSLILMFASMNWMDPTITNLVPVLNSYWLMIHVAIIVASYGFLFLGAILGLMCLWIIVFTNNENKKKLKLIINSLTNINERGITVGVFMLTIGTFLGGVWANESWGRYWGWDPKETWALVSILVYAFVLHMRLIPAISSKYSFNLASLIAIWSILMTYFGVNYYLSGLHSYAAGDPMPIPNFVYYFLFITIVTAIISRVKFKNILYMKLDILAFGAHPDDIELGCGGTILKHISAGYSVGIIDLTRGELGTRGDKNIRNEETKKSNEVLKISVRENMNFKDGFFENNEQNKIKVVKLIRKYRPSIVLTNAPSDRHPDHGRSSSLTTDACFLSGLEKIDTGQEIWRPNSIYHYIQFNNIEPDFVVDITDFFERKIQSVKCYSSQFYDPKSKESETRISSKDFFESITYRAKDLGRLTNCEYAEGFVSHQLNSVNLLMDLNKKKELINISSFYSCLKVYLIINFLLSTLLSL